MAFVSTPSTSNNDDVSYVFGVSTDSPQVNTANLSDATVNQETTRRTVNVKYTSSKVMVAIDEASFDWSYMANDEAPTNMAFMYFLDSEESEGEDEVESPPGIERKTIKPNVDKGHSHKQLEDQGYFNNGCSMHMTGNISYLTDFKEFDGGYVALGGGAKGGKITSKGIIKTGKLDFKDVYFVKDLKFNLFSVLQMCDKNYSILFTDIECFVLSPDYKLAYESHVLLKVPRKDNMYSIDMKKIVPKKDLTCLVAKATKDKSMLWHKRLGHINYKNINKLVKEILVRGLPSKRFENDQTCVACLKGKQHKVSLKSKIQNFIIQPLFMLHMELFVLTFVSSFMHKKYCLVVTGDFSRFTWNRVLVVKPHFKTPYELFRDHLRKFDGKSYEGFLVGYSTNSKASRVYNTRTRKVEKNLIINFLENKPIIACDGPKWLFYIDALTESMNYVPVIAGPSQDLILMPLWNDGSLFYSSSKDSDGDNKDNDGLCKESEFDNQERPNAENSTKDVNTDGPITTNEQGFISAIYEEKTHEDIHTYLFSCFLSQKEPKRITNALKDPTWIEVTQEELLQFHLQKVWTLVDLPKARIEAIRLFLAYASFMGFLVYQMDVKSAFLYERIEEEAFPLPVMEFPLPEEVLTASEESSHCQKKRDATAVKIRTATKVKKIQQYLQHEHYALWEVIEFGDSYEAPKDNPTTGSASDGTGKNKRRTVTLTNNDMQKRKNNVKARTTLLLAFPLRASITVQQAQDCTRVMGCYSKDIRCGNEEVNTTSVSTASTNVSTASADIRAASISQDTACAYIASQSSSSQIKFEDINQINEDDIEEMDIKRNMNYMTNDEENHALVADEEAPIEFALIAKTNAKSEVFDNSLCSKAWLAQVEARLAEHRNQEVKYFEKIRVLEFKTESRANCIESLRKELEFIKKEKEGLDSKLAGFQTASKDIDILLESQRLEKNKEGLGYSTVPPPPAQVYSSPKKDLSWTGLPEFVDDTVTDYSRPTSTIETTDRSIETKTAKVETTKPAVKYAVMYSKPSKSSKVRGNQRNWNNLKSHQLGANFVMKKRACYNCGDFDHLAYDCCKLVDHGRSWAKNNNTYKSMSPRPAIHRPYKPPIRPIRPNMNVAQPKRTSFHKPAHSYNKSPFQRTSAVRSQFRDPRVAIVNRKFPTGNTKFSTADMGNKGKAVK
nr:putative ribonuclease H-like domain-containing protein [Tanacetum cinerariifolium]